MQHRRFGRLGWLVSEIGYGMWGMGGWSGSEDAQSLRALERSIALGCNFFDTAYAYGAGRSERLIGQMLRQPRDQRIYVATKIPPKNNQWPARSHYPLTDVFPPDHMREYTEKSLENLGVERIDLQQLHVWTDAWAPDESWQRAVDELKSEGLIDGFGISVNRWEPANVIAALKTGLVDSVQVVYNIFDQAPEDELFPACQQLDIAVIARVPFDEGSLTGTLTLDSRWPQGDWRNLYFSPENLRSTLERVERLRLELPDEMDLPEMALRFILQHPVVSTTIPGMRRVAHVERNLAAADGRPLPGEFLQRLRKHRWDRSHVIP
ncbi:MAG TPA: aldo/keto reductase [Vicinamibacterales bacterium]|nr:aldo/keto reductase [Vicinamibacterales bacterium]